MVRVKNERVALQLLGKVQAASNLLTAFNSTEIECLSRFGQILYVSDTRTLMSKGDILNWFGILCTGRLEGVVDDPELDLELEEDEDPGDVLMEITPGAMVGELSCLIKTEIQMEIRLPKGELEVVLLTFGEDDLEIINSQNPDVGLKLYQMIARSATIKLKRLMIQNVGEEVYEEDPAIKREKGHYLRDNLLELLWKFLTVKKIFGSIEDTFLKKHHVALLERNMKLVTFEPDQLVCTKGQLGRSIFILLCGVVAARQDTVDSNVQYVVKRGDFFGEVEFLQSYNQDGFSYERPYNIYSVRSDECTYRLYGFCTEECKARCRAKKIEQPKTIIGVIEEKQLINISEGCPDLALAMIRSFTMKGSSRIIQDSNSFRSRDALTASLSKSHQNLKGKDMSKIKSKVGAGGKGARARRMGRVVRASGVMQSSATAAAAAAAAKAAQQASGGDGGEGEAETEAEGVEEDVAALSDDGMAVTDTKKPGMVPLDDEAGAPKRRGYASDQEKDERASSGRGFKQSVKESLAKKRASKTGLPPAGPQGSEVTGAEVKVHRVSGGTGAEDIIGEAIPVVQAPSVETVAAGRGTRAGRARRKSVAARLSAIGAIGGGGPAQAEDGGAGESGAGDEEGASKEKRVSMAGSLVSEDGDGRWEPSADENGVGGPAPAAKRGTVKKRRGSAAGAATAAAAAVALSNTGGSQARQRRGSINQQNRKPGIPPVFKSSSPQDETEAVVEEVKVKRPSQVQPPGEDMNTDTEGKIQQINSFVANSKYWNVLSQGEMRIIARQVEFRLVPADDVLLEKGDPATFLLFIIRGRAAVQINEEEVRYMEKGEVVGHMGFFAVGGLRGATVRAAEESTVAVLYYQDVYNLMESAPEIVIRLIRLLAFSEVDTLRNNFKGRSEYFRFNFQKMGINDRTDEDSWYKGSETVSIEDLKQAGGSITQGSRQGVMYHKWGEDDLARLAKSMATHTAYKGEGAVIRQGQEAKCLLWVLDGELVLRSRDEESSQEIQVLPPGEPVGGTALLNDDLHTTLLRHENIFCNTKEVKLGILTFDKLALLNYHNSALGEAIFMTSIKNQLSQQTKMVNWMVCNVDDGGMDHLRVMIRRRWLIDRMKRRLMKVRRRLTRRNNRKMAKALAGLGFSLGGKATLSSTGTSSVTSEDVDFDVDGEEDKDTNPDDDGPSWKKLVRTVKKLNKSQLDQLRASEMDTPEHKELVRLVDTLEESGVLGGPEDEEEKANEEEGQRKEGQQSLLQPGVIASASAAGVEGAGKSTMPESQDDEEPEKIPRRASVDSLEEVGGEEEEESRKMSSRTLEEPSQPLRSPGQHQTNLLMTGGDDDEDEAFAPEVVMVGGRASGRTPLLGRSMTGSSSRGPSSHTPGGLGVNVKGSSGQTPLGRTWDVAEKESIIFPAAVSSPRVSHSGSPRGAPPMSPTELQSQDSPLGSRKGSTAPNDQQQQQEEEDNLPLHASGSGRSEKMRMGIETEEEEGGDVGADGGARARGGDVGAEERDRLLEVSAQELSPERLNYDQILRGIKPSMPLLNDPSASQVQVGTFGFMEKTYPFGTTSPPGSPPRKETAVPPGIKGVAPTPSDHFLFDDDPRRQHLFRQIVYDHTKTRGRHHHSSRSTRTLVPQMATIPSVSNPRFSADNMDFGRVKMRGGPRDGFLHRHSRSQKAGARSSPGPDGKSAKKAPASSGSGRRVLTVGAGAYLSGAKAAAGGGGGGRTVGGKSSRGVKSGARSRSTSPSGPHEAAAVVYTSSLQATRPLSELTYENQDEWQEGDPNTWDLGIIRPKTVGGVPLGRGPSARFTTPGQIIRRPLPKDNREHFPSIAGSGGDPVTSELDYSMTTYQGLGVRLPASARSSVPVKPVRSMEVPKQTKQSRTKSGRRMVTAINGWELETPLCTDPRRKPKLVYALPTDRDDLQEKEDIQHDYSDNVLRDSIPKQGSEGRTEYKGGGSVAGFAHHQDLVGQSRPSSTRSSLPSEAEREAEAADVTAAEEAIQAEAVDVPAIDLGPLGDNPELLEEMPVEQQGALREKLGEGMKLKADPKLGKSKNSPRMPSQHQKGTRVTASGGTFMTETQLDVSSVVPTYHMSGGTLWHGLPTANQKQNATTIPQGEAQGGPKEQELSPEPKKHRVSQGDLKAIKCQQYNPQYIPDHFERIQRQLLEIYERQSARKGGARHDRYHHHPSMLTASDQHPYFPGFHSGRALDRYSMDSYNSYYGPPVQYNDATQSARVSGYVSFDQYTLDESEGGATMRKPGTAGSLSRPPAMQPGMELPAGTVGLTVQEYMEQGMMNRNSLPPSMRSFAHDVEESAHVGNEAYFPTLQMYSGEQIRATTAPEYPTKPRPGTVGPTGGRMTFYTGRFGGMPDITHRQQFLSQQVNKGSRRSTAKSFKEEHLSPTFLGNA